MKRTVLFMTMASLTGALVAASPKDEVQGAAKKLADAGSYSWKTTVAGGGGGGGGGQFRPGPTEGKIGKDGIALVSMTRGDNTTEAVIKGDKRAMKTQDGWRSLDELPAGGGGGGRGGRGGVAGLRNLKAPAAEAEDLVGKVGLWVAIEVVAKDLKKDGDAYSGDLTEDGAKSLLTFGGRGGGGNAPEISGAKGAVKFWVKDGVLSKYEFKVQGKVSFNGNDRDIDRTTTVEIKDVGTTKVEVPEDAKKKIS